MRGALAKSARQSFMIVAICKQCGHQEEDKGRRQGLCPKCGYPEWIIRKVKKNETV